MAISFEVEFFFGVDFVNWIAARVFISQLGLRNLFISLIH